MMKLGNDSITITEQIDIAFSVMGSLKYHTILRIFHVIKYKNNDFPRAKNLQNQETPMYKFLKINNYAVERSSQSQFNIV